MTFLRDGGPWRWEPLEMSFLGDGLLWRWKLIATRFTVIQLK